MKKFQAMALALLMLCMMMPVVAMAEDAVTTVSTEEELIAALKTPVSGTIELQNDITLTANWAGAVIPTGTTLVINGNGHTIRNMTISNYLNPGQGGDDPSSGHAASYYAGFIGNNNGTLTINNLKFYNALVDMKPAENSSGSSILAVVCANNNGSVTINDVEVDNSVVRGYTKAGILSGFSQGSGKFVANHCAITNCTLVAERDGTDPEAAVNGLIIGYDGYKKAKTNGIKLEGNKTVVDSSVEWIDGIGYNENGSAYGINNSYGPKYGYTKLGIVSTTYTRDSFGLADVVMAAQYDGYWYETLKDAIEARAKDPVQDEEEAQVKIGDAMVSFDKDASDKIFGTSESSEKLTLDVVATEEVTSVPAPAEGKTVQMKVDINFVDETGKAVYTPNNAGGSVTVSIPYEAPANTTVEVYYVPDSGAPEKLENATYSNGYVTFVVSHFSTYVVTTSASTITIIVPSEGGNTTTTPSTDNTQNPSTGANDFVGVAAAAAVMALLGSAVLLRKK